MTSWLFSMTYVLGSFGSRGSGAPRLGRCHLCSGILYWMWVRDYLPVNCEIGTENIVGRRAAMKCQIEFPDACANVLSIKSCWTGRQSSSKNSRKCSVGDQRETTFPSRSYACMAWSHPCTDELAVASTLKWRSEHLKSKLASEHNSYITV